MEALNLQAILNNTIVIVLKTHLLPINWLQFNYGMKNFIPLIPNSFHQIRKQASLIGLY